MANENGSVEKSHDLFKRSLDQRLRLRGSRKFASINAYEEYLQEHVHRRNKDRRAKIDEELRYLRQPPLRQWREPRELTVGVSPWSTIVVARSYYSVPSRLIGRKLKAVVYKRKIELFFGDKKVADIDRVSPGEVVLDYRHVIGHLVRKPGAFKNYRFRDGLFPSAVYRKCFDELSKTGSDAGEREYLHILHYAALNSEAATEVALRVLLESQQLISLDAVKELTAERREVPAISIQPANLATYDSLISSHTLGGTPA